MTHARRGFTLVEALASIVVIGLVAGVTLPLVAGSFEGYAVHTINRDTTENAGFALDRIAGLLRGAPLSDDATGLGITEATPTSVTLLDGSGLRLDGQTLLLRLPGTGAAREHPILNNVSRFALVFLGADGTTSTMATPPQTHAVHVQIETGGLALARVIFPRSRLAIVSPGPQ